jgi:hypothetical protein
MFQTTLKHWVTRSGRRIFAQRAWAVRISGAGFGSWPTPAANEYEHAADGQALLERRENLRAQKINGNGFGLTLGIAVQTAAWPTPCVPNGGRISSNKHDMNKHLDGTKAQIGLENAVRLSAWATPAARDHTDGIEGANQLFRDERSASNALLGRQAWLAGWKTPTAGCVGKGGAQNPEKRMEGGHVVDLQDQATLASWPAVPDAMDAALHLNLVPDLLSLMDSGATQVGFYADRSGVVVIPVGGPLNPEHSRWLMGYRAEVGSCGATAMQSIRTSRRGSSKRTAKRAE